MSEGKKSPQKQSHFAALLLATVVSAIGGCAMAASMVIQNPFARRFPSSGSFANFNVTRPFNATRSFNGQFVAQRLPTGLGYASWLNVVGLACLVVVAIVLVFLLFQNRSASTSRTRTKA